MLKKRRVSRQIGSGGPGKDPGRASVAQKREASGGDRKIG
jgi:hypothetical protein